MNIRSLSLRARVLARREAHAQRIELTLPVHSAFWREHRKLPGELLYVVIGDSAAQGIGASSPGRGYVGLVAEHYRSVTGASVRVLNLSVSGARLGDALAGQLPQLRELDPDLLTVSIGANDIASFEEDRFEREIEELVGQLPEGAIVADLPCFHLPRSERRVAAANRLLRAAVSRHGHTLAPLHAVTKRQGILRAVRQSAADLFHPNDRGYRVWASAFLPAVSLVGSRARRSGRRMRAAA